MRGAEFMAAWYKKEEKKSKDRAINRDGHEQGTLEKTTGQGRGVQGGEQRMGLVTAVEQFKNGMADRTARYAQGRKLYRFPQKP